MTKLVADPIEAPTQEYITIGQTVPPVRVDSSIPGAAIVDLARAWGKSRDYVAPLFRKLAPGVKKAGTTKPNGRAGRPAAYYKVSDLFPLIEWSVKQEWPNATAIRDRLLNL